MLRVKGESQPRLVGESSAIKQVRKLVHRAAPTTASVLIVGETGVGKETAARVTHAGSPRASKPFVVCDCSVISDQPIEAELFGAASSVATDGRAGFAGKLQEADGGTLFLDKVETLDLAVQARLLRFLEHPEAERSPSGGRGVLDVRVMAATTKDLAACVKEGAFRSDLYDRLNVVTIRVPPLCARPEDIEALTTLFLEQFSHQHRRTVSLTPDSLQVLCAYNWPGNVSELRSLVERIVISARADMVEPVELRELTGIEAQTPSASARGVDRNRSGRAMLERTAAILYGSPSAWSRDSGLRRPRRKHRRPRWWRRVRPSTVAGIALALAVLLAIVLAILAIAGQSENPAGRLD